MKIDLTKSDIRRHLVIWSIIIMANVLSFMIEGSYESKIVFIILSTVNLALCYYLIFIFVLPNYFFESKIICLILLLLTTLVYFSFDYFLVMVITKKLGGYTERQEINLWQFLITSTHIFSFTFIAAVGSFYNRVSILRNKESAEISKNVIQGELDFLKNQFNSHLTFNFLNLCYSKLISKSPKATLALESYSEMLRYSLLASSSKFILIEKEIAYIENFIEIQKVLTTKCYCIFSADVDDTSKLFAPMVTSVFIENAFKHGVIDDENYPIRIELRVIKSDFYLCVENCHENHNKPFQEGEGINKIRQTLDVLYSNKYTLNIISESSKFKVVLLVNIS